jgi:hypothetical protein
MPGAGGERTPWLALLLAGLVGATIGITAVSTWWLW